MKYILPLLLLLMAIPSQAEIVSYDLVGTAADIRLTSNYQEDTGLGDIQAQLCSTCTNYKLTITAESKIIKGNTPINLTQLKTYLNANRNAPMRLQFHKHTKQVFYIKLNTQDKEYPQ